MMKLNRSIALAVLVLATLACNMMINVPISRLKTGPTETFSIEEPAPAGATITDVSMAMTPSTATLELAGGSLSLADGEIQYNVAEWKPIITTKDGILRIEQRLPDDKIRGETEGGVNQWKLKLGSGLMNVRVDCPAGDFTLDFADTLPDGVRIFIDMGAGNLRLVIPAGTATSVEVDRGPSKVVTEGEWTASGSTYATGGSGPTWRVYVEMGVGMLILATQ